MLSASESWRSSTTVRGSSLILCSGSLQEKNHVLFLSIISTCSVSRIIFWWWTCAVRTAFTREKRGSCHKLPPASAPPPLGASLSFVLVQSILALLILGSFVIMLSAPTASMLMMPVHTKGPDSSRKAKREEELQEFILKTICQYRCLSHGARSCLRRLFCRA